MRPLRTRREPPPFRRVEVARVEARSRRLRRITLTGPELAGLPSGLPAASVRLLLPGPGGLELPTWDGNEFRAADGSRPAIRTLTPVRTATDPGTGAAPELDVEVVLHGAGPLAGWAARAAPGDRVAVAGTGRGYEVDPAADRLVLVGDESALPAITLLLAALDPALAVDVVVEVAHPDGRLDLPARPGTTVGWCDLPPGAGPGDALVPAVLGLDLAGPGTRLWAAGEAAAMQRIRRHLADEAGVPRERTTVRGYWKRGRGEGDVEGDAPA